MDREHLTGRALTGATSFVLAIGVLMVVLVLSVVRLGGDAIESRAIASAEQLGITVTEALVVPSLAPNDLTTGVSAGRLQTAIGNLRDRLARTPFERVTIYDEDGRVVISEISTLLGADGTRLVEVREALGGTVGTDLESADDPDPGFTPHDDWTLEVFVPVRIGASDRVLGVAQLYLPFGETLDQVDSDVTQLTRILGVGLTLLWGIVAALTFSRFRDEARTRWLADHDALTALPNRTAFERQVHAAVADPRSGPAVLVLDLDGFKDVNDTHGHHAGDALLIEVGRRWAELVRDGDIVSRLGSDEFAVLLHRTDAAGLETVVERLREAGGRPVRVRDDAEVAVSVSVGVALGPEDGADHDELLQRADLALYRAKQLHLGWARFDPARDTGSHGRFALLQELRAAVERQEFVLHHQPKLDMRTGRVLGLEALVRWQHPTRGLLYPDEFIGLAEQSGLAPALTEVVVAQALSSLAEWRREHPDLRMAVNLSTRDLLTDDVLTAVVEELQRHGLPAHALELEVTETAAMIDRDRSLERLHRLSALGVRLAVDDYGTGHATLGYLSRLPIDVLKIDRSFVMGHHEPANAAIIESTVALGHRLGLEVVAEGVEDEAAVSFLRFAGCDILQGYHYSRPVPAADVLATLERLNEAAGPSGPTAAGGDVADRLRTG